ncbi:MAG TPA: hypothetical protein VMT89_04935, partial [Candidatus Acidoferrales bacterium]|nr:hypothetical protein [Candidatus Acidoferrales bacterium]
SLQARVCFGPAALYQGILAAGLGHAGEAMGYFERAHELARRLRGRPLLALIEVEMASALSSLGDLSAARRRLGSARQIAVALGLELIHARIAGVEANLQAAIRGAAATDTEVPATESTKDEPRHGGASPQPLRALLKREGALWTVSAGDTVLRCRTSKGLQYLAHLLRNPGKSFHAIELMALDQNAGEQRVSGREIDELGLRVGTPQSAEPIADAKALAAYRRRIEDLATELAEATEMNDIGRRTQLQSELDILSETLAGAVGIGGRARATGSFAERARLNVTRAIRSAIERIAEGIPVLGSHLDSAIRTGTFCSYSPRTAGLVHWDL